MKIYFAHPLAHYNTETEAECLAVIKACMFGADIVNPNSPEHDGAYQKIGFDYFHGLVESCDALVYAPFLDGEVGAGVYAEILTMLNQSGKIFKVMPGWVGTSSKEEIRAIRPLSILQTRERADRNII